MRSPSLRRLMAINAAISLTVVAAWHVTRTMTESVAPTIKVRWVGELPDHDRMALERQFQLLDAEAIGNNTYNYSLIDSRVPVIRALVEHPAVRDTGDLDRSRFTVAVITDPSDRTRWIWHRWGTVRAETIAFRTLHAWALVSAASLLVANKRR